MRSTPSHGHRSALGPAFLAVVALAATSHGQTVTPEVEPNQSKETATRVLGMQPGDLVTGQCTSTTLTGPQTADMFLIRTAPAPVGLYEYRLSLSSANATQHSGLINGLQFTTACLPTSQFTQLDSSSAGTIGPWYGAGQEEFVYVTLLGSHLTPLPYTMHLQRQEALVLNLPRALHPGVIVAAPSGGLSSLTVGVYDELLRRSEPSRWSSSMTRSFSPGFYYIGLTPDFRLYDAPICPSGASPNRLTMDSFNSVYGRLSGSFAFTITDSEGSFTLQSSPGRLTWVRIYVAPPTHCGSADFNGDGDLGTDQDIDAFFACLAGSCCATCDAHGSDFNGDGDFGTDRDIEAFFRILAGGAC
jgi:hypothetical protein